MLVELAAEGLEHGLEGQDWGRRLSHFVIAAPVLDACHCWLEYGKILGRERSLELRSSSNKFYRSISVV